MKKWIVPLIAAISSMGIHAADIKDDVSDWGLNGNLFAYVSMVRYMEGVQPVVKESSENLANFRSNKITKEQFMEVDRKTTCLQFIAAGQLLQLLDETNYKTPERFKNLLKGELKGKHQRLEERKYDCKKVNPQDMRRFTESLMGLK